MGLITLVSCNSGTNQSSNVPSSEEKTQTDTPYVKINQPEAKVISSSNINFSVLVLKYKGKILTVGSVEPWGTSYDIYFNFDKTLIPSDELVNLLTKNILSTNLDNNSKVTLVYFCDKLPAFNRYEKVPDDFTITRQTYDLK